MSHCARWAITSGRRRMSKGHHIARIKFQASYVDACVKRGVVRPPKLLRTSPHAVEGSDSECGPRSQESLQPLSISSRGRSGGQVVRLRGGAAGFKRRDDALSERLGRSVMAVRLPLQHRLVQPVQVRRLLPGSQSDDCPQRGHPHLHVSNSTRSEDSVSGSGHPGIEHRRSNGDWRSRETRHPSWTCAPAQAECIPNPGCRFKAPRLRVTSGRCTESSGSNDVGGCGRFARVGAFV